MHRHSPGPCREVAGIRAECALDEEYFKDCRCRMQLERHCIRIAQRLSQRSKRGLLVSVLELQTLVRAAILREPEQGCVMAWLEGMYPERGTVWSGLVPTGATLFRAVSFCYGSDALNVDAATAHSLRGAATVRAAGDATSR